MFTRAYQAVRTGVFFVRILADLTWDAVKELRGKP